MSHPFDVCTLPSGGQFIFTPCPGTKDVGLEESLTALKAAGAVGVVTMLSHEELEFLNVPAFGDVCHQLGLAWYQLPVEDDCAPEAPFESAFANLKATLMNHLEAKDTLVIHCRGGTGRTGLMAAILLLEQGHDWSTVKACIQAVRPKALTLAPHLNYLKKYIEV